MRFRAGENVTNRYGTSWVHNVTELDSSKSYKWQHLDDHVIAVESGGSPLSLYVFNGSGAPVTVYQQATMDFTAGGGGTGVEIEIGDTVVGATSGATGVVTGIRVDSGDWSTNNAAGVLTIRWTSDPTGFLATGETLNVGGVNHATLTMWGTPSATALNGPIGYSYLGSTLANVRLYSIEDSIFILNVDQTVATNAARAGSVANEKKSYISPQGTPNAGLSENQAAAVGEIYKTVISDPGFPASYYKCTQAYSLGPPEILPRWRRIPKPGQEDAFYDASTMPHRLLRINATTYEWQRLPWDGRLSGGDVEGEDEYGEPVIRNKAVLKGRKIVAMTLWAGRMVFALDNKQIALSVSQDFYNFWLDDVNQTIPSDRIVDELIATDSGNVQWVIGAGEVLFIQGEHVQAQYGSRGDILSAGGPEQPYNGRIDLVGHFEASDVEPVAWANAVFMLDANRYVRPYYYMGADTGYRLQPLPPLNDHLVRDMVADTIEQMRFEDQNLYALTSDGKVWISQIWGVRSGNSGAYVAASWSWMEMDESIAFLFAYSNRLHIVTTYQADFTFLTQPITDQAPDAGFDYPRRFDREETLEGIWDSTDNETAWTPNTLPTVGSTRVELLSDLVKLNFDNGTAAINVGDTLTGATSGATGVVFRISLQGGTTWGDPAYGYLMVRKTNAIAYQDDENLQVSAATKAVANGDEIEKGVKGQLLDPVGLLVSYNSGGTDTLVPNVIVVGATSGARATVHRVDLDSGDWGAGTAVGDLILIPIDESVRFQNGENLDVEGGFSNICTLTSDDGVIVFTGEWGPTSGNAGSVDVSHRIGRLFESYVKWPEIWPGLSKDRMLVTSISVFHDLTTDYDVRFIRDEGDYQKVLSFTSKKIGQYVHGESVLDTGFFESLVGAVGRNLVVQVESSSSGQFQINGMEIEYERSRF